MTKTLGASEFKISHRIKFRSLIGGTARKVSKYGVISGPYFPVFGLNTRKYGPEITPYLDTFHTVRSPRVLKHREPLKK